MLTQDQLKANIDAMEKQGAKPNEIQGYLDSLKGSGPTGSGSSQSSSFANGGANPPPTTPQPGIMDSIKNAVSSFAGGTSSGNGAVDVGNAAIEGIKGAVKGAGSTLLGMSELGQKTLGRVAEAGGRALGTFFGTNAANAPSSIDQSIQATQDFKDKHLTASNNAQKLGYGAEQVAEFMLPGGAVSDVAKAADLAAGAGKMSKLTNFGTKMALEGGLSSGITAMQSGGDAHETLQSGLAGAAFPIAGVALKGLGKIGSAVAEHLASTMSGVPKEAIQHAISNPEAVQRAVSMAAQDGEGAAQKIYSNAVDALDSLKQERHNAFTDGLANLEKEATYTKNGQLYVKRELTPAEAKNLKGYIPGTKIGVPTDLSTNGVKNVFTRTAKEFGAEGGGLHGLDYTNVALDDAHISKLQKLQERLYSWNDATPTGINKLRQVIDSYKIGGVNLGSSESKFNKIVGDLRTNLADYVGSRVPQVAAMNKEYASASEVIDNIRSQLKIGSADPNTALRKLVNVFNPKSSLYRPVVKQLGEKGGKDLMSDIAGLVMSKLTPEGLGKYITSAVGGAGGIAALSHPVTALGTLPVMAMSSPRLVGKAATTFGRAMKNPSARALAGSAARGAKAFTSRSVAEQSRTQ
jgi:hypothetical protein